MAVALGRVDPQAEALEAIAEVGELFTTTLHLRPTLERIIRSAMAVVHGDAGSILLLTPERDVFAVAAAVRGRAGDRLSQRQQGLDHVAGHAAGVGETLTLKGSLTLLDNIAPEQPSDADRTLVVPLRVAGRHV